MMSLADFTGIPDAVYCHPGGFVAGAKTRDSALKLAKKVLELS